MTTTAQVKSLIQPLLSRRPYLAFSRRLVFARPVHHILAAVDLDRSSDKAAIIAGTRVLPVFHSGTPHVSWGWGVGRPDKTGFRIDQPDVQDVLIRTLEQDVLPKLAAIADIADFERYVLAHENRHMFEFGYHLTTAVALGRLDRAREICRGYRARRTLEPTERNQRYWPEITRLRTLCELVEADDRAGMIALLHQWEAATAADWGIAKYWEPSPFPIEAM